MASCLSLSDYVSAFKTEQLWKASFGTELLVIVGHTLLLFLLVCASGAAAVRGLVMAPEGRSPICTPIYI